MNDIVTINFYGEVVHIDKDPEKREYMIFFGEHSALYTVSEENIKAVEILFRAKCENRSVSVIHDASTMEILEAKIL